MNKKRIIDLTVDELEGIVGGLLKTFLNNNNNEEENDERGFGLKAIAETFGCSISTALRIKNSGMIDEAITQVGRKICVNKTKALALAKERGIK